MKSYLLPAVLLIAGLFSACTENQIARQYGGETTIKLPPGQKLINATWKDHDLWYLTRPMREGEEAETLTFREDSSFGLMNGAVIFVESK